MTKKARRILGFVLVLPALLLVAIVLALLIGPPGPHFTCHHLLVHAFEQWKIETRNGDWYPNVAGDGRTSLNLIAPYMKYGSDELRDYRYVPGLKDDDPADLILAYVRKPSWRTWHGDTHWIRSDRRWVVLNPRFSPAMDTDARGYSEDGEAITTTEFHRRLQATLDYLKAQNRPFCTNVVQEHSVFLSSP